MKRDVRDFHLSSSVSHKIQDILIKEEKLSLLIVLIYTKALSANLLLKFVIFYFEKRI